MNLSKLHALFLALAFSAWILPLGQFIKPSEEYKTCGGKRAFHQCSMMQGKVRTESSPIAYSAASGAESQPKSAASSPGFEALKTAALHAQRQEHYFAEFTALRYLNPSAVPLAPPPKFSF